MVKSIRIRKVHTNSLSCEPIVRRMPNGDLLCVSQCGGITEPTPENRVFVFRSKDNGETWENEGSIYPEDGQAVYNTELSVIGDEVTAYLTIHTGRFFDWKCLMMKSRDNGHTWQNAGTPPYFPEYTFLRGTIVTRDGRIVIPYHHYPVTREEHDKLLASDDPLKAVWKTKTEYCENGVLVSADNGRSYERNMACRMPLGVGLSGWIWSEPTIAELSDGTLAMLMRRDNTGALWRCDSKDGGITWGDLYDTGIPNPGNKSKLISLGGSRIALLHTPNQKKRFPYELWISDDDMKTWSEKVRLTDFPGTYSYSDGFYEDGHILFTIEHNRHMIVFFDVEL